MPMLTTSVRSYNGVYIYSFNVVTEMPRNCGVVATANCTPRCLCQCALRQNMTSIFHN